MAINFRRKLEGVAAQLNPFDQGKTYSSVVNQPQRPAPQGGGSVSVGAPVSQAPAYTPGRISVSGAPPSQQPQPQSNFQIARNAFQSNPVGRVAGGLASSFALPYNVVGKGLGTAIAQVSPDVRRAKASQDMLAEQNKQSVAALNQQLRNPGLSVEQRAKVQKAVGAITQNTQDVMGQQAQTAQDVAAITDPRKQAASIGSIGFDIATLGVGTGGTKAVSAALKSGGIKQAAKTLGTQSAKTAGLAAPSGALFPVIEKGKDATIKDILTGAGTAAAFGAALPGISSGVAAGAKPIVKAIKGAPKLNQVGAIGKDVNPKIPSKIHPEDQAVMSDFIDYARKVYKPDAKETPKLELEASRLAEHYGLDTSKAKTVGQLADVFDKTLQNTKKSIFSLPKLNQGGYVQVPGKTPTTKVTQEQLFDTDPLSTFRAKVRTVGGEKNVPVTKVATQGDVLTKTNVKTGAEKRFTIDDAGELIPDRKGAYRIFSDKENKITGFRIGDKFYDGKDFGNLADVNNYGSTIATMRRNLERAYKDNPVAQDKVQRFIVDHQQEQATKMVERQVALRDGAQALADDLGINFRTGTRKAKDVSADIQNFGEGVITKEDLVSKYGSDKASKIIRADSWFRNQYDSLLNEMNTTLTKFGYSPVPKRENYYTHFQEPSLWKNFGLKMQEINDAFGGPMQEATPTATRGSIPNALAGQSEYLLPNKRFNPFAKKREGGAYTPDAFKAFERYLSPTLNNIYMTPSIARTRVMTKAIAQANDLAGNDVNKLALQMTEWANELAGKTNRWDRTLISSDWANKALKASEYVQRKVGQQSIVGNLATAVMQPVVLAQTAAKAGYKNTLLGLLQEFPGAPGHAKDAPIRLSGFLKRRYLNTTPVTSGKMDKASSIAGTPLKVIEETAGRVTWNSYYNQALEKGLKGKEAIRHADIWAEKTMAGRSIGEKPELYKSKAMGIATQFQLEVNNMWQQLGKEFSKTEVAKFVVASYAANMLIQEIIGRQPSFNPLDAAIDSVAIMANDEKTAKQKGVEVAQRVGGEIVGSTPILPSAIGAVVPDDITKKVFGNQTPVGRFGVGSTAGSLVENTVGKVLQGKPLEAGAYLATPFGYGQAQKTVKGINAVSQGKLTNKDGETTVEIPQTPINYVKGALFGPSAIKEVNQYYNNIGVKSEDQKPVQNQTTSVAAKQGGGSATTEKSRGDLMKEAKTITKQGFEGKYAKLSEEQITNLAQNGDEDALSLMNSLKAQEKVYAKPNLPTAGLNKSAEDILNKEKKFTETGRKAWGSRQVSDKTLQSAVNQWKPANAPDVPVNNNIAIEWAKYERDDKLGKLTELEKRDKRVSILKKAYTSDLNEDEARYGGMSDAKLADAVDEGLVSPDSLKKALDADAKLIAYGLIDKSSFGKKIWAAFGLGVPGSKSSGGGYASGRNGGSRGGGGGKAVAAKAINPYKYNVSLTAGGSVAKPKVQARAVGAVKSQKVAKAKPKVSIKKSTA